MRMKIKKEMDTKSMSCSDVIIYGRRMAGSGSVQHYMDDRGGSYEESY